MILKEIIIREFHFNSPEECDKHMKAMESIGYKIISSGSEDDWYFTCRKEIKSGRV